MSTFKEHIIKTGGGYKLVSKKTGKNLGTATTKAGIEKRERQVQYFKHMHEDKRMLTFKEFVREDGMGAGAVATGPTNTTGPQSGTDPASASAVDNRDKKHRGPKNNPILFTKPETRKPQKV
jgi:hypothetical protein